MSQWRQSDEEAEKSKRSRRNVCLVGDGAGFTDYPRNLCRGKGHHSLFQSLSCGTVVRLGQIKGY